MDTITALRFGIGLAVFASAAYSDLRTRLVNDLHWHILAVAGTLIALAEAMLYHPSELALLGILASFATFEFFMNADYLYDAEEGKVNWPYVPVILYGLGMPVYSYLYGGFYDFMYSLPALMIWLYFIMYYYGLIGGGADAKALMAASILVPLYPTHAIKYDLVMFIMELTPLGAVMFQPSMSLLLNASLVAVFMPLIFYAYNLTRGEYSPLGFLAVRMPPEKARKSFMWPMEYLDEGGNLKRLYFPTLKGITREDTERIFRELEEKGYEKVWVNPKLPFIVFLALGYVILFLWGNLLMLLL